VSRGTYGGGGGSQATGALPTYIVAGADAPTSIKALADAVGPGTDDTAVLATAFAQLGTKEVHLYGSFVLTAALTAPAVDNVRLINHGGTIYVADVAYPGVGIKFAGSRADTGATFAGSKPQGTITLAAATLPTPPVAGDRCAFVAASAATGQPFGGTIAERPGENLSGEWLDVESVSGTTITLRTSLRETYDTTTYSYKLFKYTLLKGLYLAGLRLVGVGGAGHPVTTSASNRGQILHVEYCDRPFLEDIAVDGAPYARHGIGVFECFEPVVDRPVIRDVNDINGTTGLYEAYGVRFMGCVGGEITGAVGLSGCRHFVELNGGNTGYNLTTTCRPINRDAIIENSAFRRSYGAACGDHPGCEGTTYRNLTAHECSGLIFTRGHLTAVYGRMAMFGGNHLTGPYAANQGNDHLLTIGEQIRDTGGANRADSHGGWCGTDIVIDAEFVHDLTGNGANGSSASTSHTIYAVHPLDSATLLVRGKVKPTGNVVNAIGDYNRDSTILVEGADLSNAFSGATNGWFVRLAPVATTPPTTTGQTSTNMTITVTGGVKPRSGGIYVAGNAAADANAATLNIKHQSRTLGGTLTSASPLIVLAANPNGGTGVFGPVRMDSCDMRDVAAVTSIDATAASGQAILWEGLSQFLDGNIKGGREHLFLRTGELRRPEHVGMTTYTPTASDKAATRLWRVEGMRQAVTAFAIMVTAIGAGGATQTVTPVVYADDGFGRPALGKAPLFFDNTKTINPQSATGQLTVAISFTEPAAPYWLGYVYDYVTVPTTFPTLAAYTVQSVASDVIGSGTAALERRSYTASTTAGAAGGTITSVTNDTNTRAASALVAA
jgi:hypothetical protein